MQVEKTCVPKGACLGARLRQFICHVTGHWDRLDIWNLFISHTSVNKITEVNVPVVCKCCKRHTLVTIKPK